jgi:hypothetical protein
MAIAVGHSRRGKSNHGQSPTSRKIPKKLAGFSSFFEAASVWEAEFSEPNRTPGRA